MTSTLFSPGGGTLGEIRDALAEQNLEVPTTVYMKSWFETTGEEHAEVLGECRRRMRQAVEVGAVHIIASPPMGVADRDQGAKNYREILEIGREIGVQPAMEFLGFVEDYTTIEDALETITKADHPDATLVLDPFHIFRGGGSMESITKLTADQVAICHFNDAPTSPPREEQHDVDRVYPGDGHVDLKRMLNLLRQIGYDRWLSLELFHPELWKQDPREVARVGLEKMRAVAES